MLNVTIDINGHQIIRRSVRRTEPFKGPDDLHLYNTDDGRTIFHKYSDGAEALAAQLLAVSTRSLMDKLPKGAARRTTQH
jgi:hypothetical protein